MKLAIVDSRNLSHVTKYVWTIPDGIEVVSGGAHGVDDWAIYNAKLRPYSVIGFNLLF